jgi:hypothetical protein
LDPYAKQLRPKADASGDDFTNGRLPRKTESKVSAPVNDDAGGKIKEPSFLSPGRAQQRERWLANKPVKGSLRKE